MTFNQTWTNIASQFGMPLFGVSGNLPFAGNYFWVDPVNGSDGNTGGPQDPFATLVQAHTAAKAGNNDVVFLTGTYSPAATLTWSKNNTHLIGLSAPGSAYPAASIAVANTAATTGAFSPLVNVTATGCYFANITVLSGIAQAATQVCWAEAGGSNTYNGMQFNQVGNATAAAQAGTRALTIASKNNTFTNCIIGSDAVVRATSANNSVDLLAGSGSSTFRHCVFPMWSSVAGNTFISAAAATVGGYILLDGCMLINDLGNTGYVANTAAIVNSSAVGVILLSASTVSVGATAIATTGNVYGAQPVPTGTTSGIAVALT